MNKEDQLSQHTLSERLKRFRFDWFPSVKQNPTGSGVRGEKGAAANGEAERSDIKGKKGAI